MSSESLPGTIPQRARTFWVACTVLYVFLSCVDLYVTWLLVHRADLAYEANPLAAGILQRFGWIGLGIFKLACVTFVLGVGLGLWRRRPRTARLLLGFGCLSSLAVVGYSLWLIEGGDLVNWSTQLAKAERQWQTLQSVQRKQHAYFQHTEALVDDLVRGKRTLAEATAELSAFLRRINHDPVRYLLLYYPNLEEEACLAAHLVRMVGFEVAGDPELSHKQLGSLARQFAVYQAPLPSLSTESFASLKPARGRRPAMQ